MFTFRRQRADEPAPTYDLRRAAAEDAHEQRERELDEWDALMYEAHEITHQADTLALRMAMGTATPSEVQEFLATDHGNPYADLASVELQCAALGLDPSTGLPRG
jgi:CRISPR/Cas system-associated exonuclease Cas4 (RecB family)